MTRSNLLTLVLASVSLLSIAPRAAIAQRLLNVAAPINGVLTSKTCDAAVTPVVHSISVSAPAAGTGLSCTNDTQCTGAGEYCGFDIGATTSSCKASGLLKRDNIHYVAGNLIDVDSKTNVTCLSSGAGS